MLKAKTEAETTARAIDQAIVEPGRKQIALKQSFF
jgi:hypothetical protein